MLRPSWAGLLAGLLAWPLFAQAQLDLQKVQRSELPNGLTVLLLEEHTFPSVSTQMLYRIGARNEQVGQTGLAHFLEHMAFRASENFPDTEVVSQIYAAGGEWHGYTWVDQTTYYSTVPSAQLDLLLRIEADRMQRLLTEPQWLEPEKGAVLAEMHGYENDPASVLHDAVVFAAFQGHPYRNNVIGWESDIVALQHADVLAFYRQHYLPANAVLAVVGDFNAAEISQRIADLFGDFLAAAPAPLPHTREPQQLGERRLELLGGGTSHHFEIAYRAPAANHPDFPAMLVLQEWLSGGSGVNFMQEFGTTTVQPGSALYGKVADLNSWFPPAAEEYLFSLRGSIEADQEPAETESVIESVLQGLRSGDISEDAVQAAKARVQEQLIFDLGTHEETAHQLAFYQGLNALDAWLNLPANVASVSKAELINLAQRRLQPWQRNIAWYRAGDKPSIPGPIHEPANNQALSAGITRDPAFEQAGVVAASRAGSTPPVTTSPNLAGQNPLPPAEMISLDNGIQLLLQTNPVSRSVYLSLLIRGSHWLGSDQLQVSAPRWGLSSLSAEVMPDQLENKLALLLAEAALLQHQAQPEGSSTNPSSQMEYLYMRMLGLDQAERQGETSSPVDPGQAIEAVVISGLIEAQQLNSIRQRLSQLSRPRPPEIKAVTRQGKEVRMDWPAELAQAQLGYAVPAPGPRSDDYLAWRALQYTLAHDYEGRLGKEAVSNRGLAYYLDSQYRSDGKNSWSSISVGVDPAKLEVLEALFREQLVQLLEHPPSTTEVEEARNHLLGRLLTARQSNVELAAGLAEQWLWYGRLLSQTEQLEAISKLGHPQVLALLPRFTDGAFVVIEAGK